MAGSAYKGLTIRVGGDVTPLTQALHAAESAAAATQRQLRTLQNAAKLDPSNAKVFEARLSGMSDKAQALRSKLLLMSEAVRQMKSDGIDQLAAQTENASLRAARATESYNKVNLELTKMYNEFKKLTGVKLNTDDLVKELDKYVGKMKESGKLTDEQAAKLAELRSAWTSLGDSLNVDTAEQAMRDLGMVTEDTHNEFRQLRDVWSEARAELDTSRAVAGFEDLQIQIEATKAEARQLAIEYAQLKAANPSITQTEGFARLKAEMQQVESATSSLKAELSTVDEALRLDPTSMDAATGKMRTMQELLRADIEQAKLLDKQLSQMRAEGIDKVSEKSRNLALDFERAKAEVAEFKAKLDTAKAALDAMESGKVDMIEADFRQAQQEVREYTTLLGQAEAKLDSLGNAQAYRSLSSQQTALNASMRTMVADMTGASAKTAALSGAMQQLGWAAYSTVTPAVMMFGQTAINAADEVDSAYRDMRKTVQGTDEQFEDLKQSALDFSRTHVTSADQILEIEAMGGQLGISADKLKTFAETISNVSIAAESLDADTIAEQFGQLSGMLNDMTQDDFPKYGDALVRLGNNNATLESKIQDVMLRIASMGTITGFTTPQLLAWSTAVAATGQGAEAAGTAISKTMSDIENAVGEGGDALGAFAAVAGKSSEEFAASWSTDPSGTMQQFILGLKNIEASGGSADATLEELGITSVRQKQAILGLTQTIGKLDENMTMSKDAWDGVGDQWGQAGDAAREASKKAEGFSGAVQLLKNNAQILGVEVGEFLAPAITMLGDAVSAATQGFSDMSPAAKGVVVGLAAILAALGPTTVIVNATSQAWKALNEAYTLANSAWAKTVKANADVNQSMQQMSLFTDEATGSQNKLTTAQKAGAVAKKALAAAGVALAAVIAVKLIQAYMEASKRNQELTQATFGLERAQSAALGTTRQLDAGFTSSASKTYSNGLMESKAAVDELVASQASLADSIRERFSDTYAEVALIGTYKDAIVELNGNTDPTAQANLAIAIKAVNDACGTSYQIDEDTGRVADNTGAVIDNTDAIDQLIEAKMREAQMNALMESYQDMYKQNSENARELAAATVNLKNAQDEYDAAVAAGVTDLESLSANLATAEDNYNRVNSATVSGRDAMARYKEQMTLLQVAITAGGGTLEAYVADNALFMESIQAGGNSLMDFIEDVKATGVSVEDFRTLNDEQLLLVAQAYQGNAESVAAILQQLGIDCIGYGVGASTNLGSGVESGRPAVQSAAGNVASDVEAMDRSGDSYSWGSHTSGNFVAGILAGSEPLENALSGISSMVGSYLQHTTPKRGAMKDDDVWGAHMMQNFITAMRSKERELALEVSKASNIVSDGFLSQIPLSMDIGYFTSNAGSLSRANASISSQSVSNTAYGDTNNYSIGSIDVAGDAELEAAMQVIWRRVGRTVRAGRQ